MLEVQVPVLSKHTVTDPDIESIGVSGHGYLQTSPEYLMKKLLSSGSPSIYSIGPAFREGEMGRNHRPEFIMIEWYRVGIDELQLIEEIKELLQEICDKNISILITDHNVRETLSLCNKAIILSEGSIIAEGSEKKLKENAHVQDKYFGKMYRIVKSL